MKRFNLKNKTMAATATVAATATTAANAALSTDVVNAINGGFTDANSAMGLMVVGFAGLFAVGLVIRLVRK